MIEIEIADCIQEGWQYEPVAFKDRLSYNFTRTQLSSLDIAAFLSLPAFAKRMYCSPLCRHFDATMIELCDTYAKEDIYLYGERPVPSYLATIKVVRG